MNTYIITFDYVSWSKKVGIKKSGRGTASSSIVNYALGITDIDPIEFNLSPEDFFCTKNNFSSIELNFDYEKQ